MDNMNWVDIILIVFFIKSFISGFSKGFILAAFKMAGVIAGIWIGVIYRDAASDFLKNRLELDEIFDKMLLEPILNNNVSATAVNAASITELALKALGFFAVFLIVQLGFLVIAYIISGMIKIVGLSLFNKVCGGIFSIIQTALWIAILNTVIFPFMVAFPESFLQKGLSASYILNHLRFLDFISPILIKFI